MKRKEGRILYSGPNLFALSYKILEQILKGECKMLVFNITDYSLLPFLGSSKLSPMKLGRNGTALRGAYPTDVRKRAK